MKKILNNDQLTTIQGGKIFGWNQDSCEGVGYGWCVNCSSYNVLWFPLVWHSQEGVFVAC